jgi:DNA modification methylase
VAVKTILMEGKCQEVMRTMRRRFALVFADQPFNIGHKYAGYEDKLSAHDFELFTQDWIYRAWNVVDDGGVLAIHGSIKLLPIHWRAIFQLSLGACFENEVVWHYRFGQCGYSDWVDGHCHCLILRKPGGRRWYPDEVLVESDRMTKYKDKRVAESAHGGMRPPSTVWGTPSDGVGWGRVTKQSKERWRGHPNQLPLRYVQRIVLAYTQPGDWVLDPFVGSGTAGVVCKHEGRNFIGIDISKDNVDSARERIEVGYYHDVKQENAGAER